VRYVQVPVRLFVSALIESPGGAGRDDVVAVELAVPMICAGKRMKKETKGERVVITDYIKRGTETLGYEWTDEIARLYEQDS
jgi:hypothetical protein